MGRPKKVNTDADMNAIAKLVLEGYEITHREPDAPDFTGVSYAERLGEAKSVFNRIVAEMGLTVRKGTR